MHISMKVSFFNPSFLGEESPLGGWTLLLAKLSLVGLIDDSVSGSSDAVLLGNQWCWVSPGSHQEGV